MGARDNAQPERLTIDMQTNKETAMPDSSTNHFRRFAFRLIGGTLLMAASTFAMAQDTIRIGLVAPFSGPFSEFGKHFHNGMKAWLAINGDTVAGKKIEILVKDDAAAPEAARRLAQELVLRDKVDFLAGFGLTPEAMAAAPVATQAKKPMILMNAAASGLTAKSPYMVRMSFTQSQTAIPLATWAAQNGIRKVYTLVSDYGPGIDSEEAFKKTFIAAGGEIIGSSRAPLQNPDFAPFTQRIKDAAPQAVFTFLPAGEAVIGFMKNFSDRGLADAGIKLLAATELTVENLKAAGDASLAAVASTHYLETRDTPENRAFVKAYKQVTGEHVHPLAVAGYDGMAAISEVGKRLNGKIDGDKAMAILKGLQLNSPRGPVRIDKDTRDIVQNIYILRPKKAGTEYSREQIATFENVGDFR